MSRSYRKPYSYYICIKPRTVRNIKRVANRRYRRKLKQGYYDSGATRAMYKRIEDIKWCEDLAKHYVSLDCVSEDYYKTFLRK